MREKGERDARMTRHTLIIPEKRKGGEETEMVVVLRRSGTEQ